MRAITPPPFRGAIPEQLVKLKFKSWFLFVWDGSKFEIYMPLHPMFSYVAVARIVLNLGSYVITFGHKEMRISPDITLKFACMALLNGSGYKRYCSISFNMGKLPQHPRLRNFARKINAAYYHIIPPYEELSLFDKLK